MNTESLVSIVIPNYNYGRFLAEAIESALAQTYPHIEVIVVDDGSTDDSCRVLESFGGLIRTLFQENRGPAAARNAGVRVASGANVQFLDADDVLLPRAVERLLEVLQAHPECGLVSGIAIKPSESSGIAAQEGSKKISFISFEDLVLQNSLVTSCTLARREVLIQNGLFDEDRAWQSIEDYFMWLRISRTSGVCLLVEPLVRYRIHASNISSNQLRQVEREVGLFCRLLEMERDARVRRLLCHKKRRLFHEWAYHARESGDRALFKKRARAALLRWPWYWKNWAYWVFAHFPLSSGWKR